MPREYPTYRDNLERLNEVYPSRDLLTRPDIIAFTGLSHNTVRKVFPFSGRYMSKANFARILAQMGGGT